jgi:hypothetical protein
MQGIHSVHFFHRAIGFNHSLLQVVTNSLILCGWIKHTKKGIVCQENRTLVITNSNHAYFVKILGREFQEVVLTEVLISYVLEDLKTF